jgi:hypothetical protein
MPTGNRIDASSISGCPGYRADKNRYSCFEAEILNGTSGFNRLQNNDDRVLSESGFTHGDLLGNTTSMSEEL